MGIKDVLLNIATLGAHQRVKNEVEKYEDYLNELNDLNEKHEKRKTEVNEILETVIEVKKKAILFVRKTRKILKNVNIKQRELINNEVKSGNYSLDRIEASITAGDMAISATKGAVAGVSTALGTWALVGTFGIASTGTAIGTLSGAAASNAILAWLGGGSIAAGGGGIAAGTAVLGGLVAIPVLAISGLFQHLAANKKIKQLKEEEIKVLGYINDIKKNLVKFDAIEMRSKEVNESINKSLEAYRYEYKTVYRKIFPLGIVSKINKGIKNKIFRKPYYSDKDLAYIHNLGSTTGFILKMVDSPIF
jgi:esterase/lipase